MKQFNWWYLNISATVGALAAGAIFKWDARAFSIIAICLQYFLAVFLGDAKLGRGRTIQNQKILAFVCGLISIAISVLGVRLRWFPGLYIQSPIFIVEEYAFTVTAAGVFYFRFWLIFLLISRYLFHATCNPGALVVLTKNATVAYSTSYEVQPMEVDTEEKEKEKEKEKGETLAGLETGESAAL